MSDLISAVGSMLEAGPRKWALMIESFTPEALARVPAPGEWSALGCLQHIVDLDEVVFGSRIRAILEGRTFEAYDPDIQGHAAAPIATGPVLVGQLEHVPGATLELVRSLREDDLARTSTHAELDAVSLHELLNEWAGHYLLHYVQAERALMQPFIQGMGPWRASFSEHEAWDAETRTGSLAEGTRSR